MKVINRLNPQAIRTCFQEISCNYKGPENKSDLPKITGSKDAYDYFKAIWSDKIEYVEEFTILCLNRAHAVIGWAKISQGGISGTVADPKVIFQIALKSNSSAIILAHNHPSGNFLPSEEDIRLTTKLKNAGAFLDLPVLDHIILGDGDRFYSFGDEGLI